MSSEESPTSLVGNPVASLKAVGRYELIEPIAIGGMATVYLGRTTGPGGFKRLVAVKVCHPHLSMQGAYREMFLDEARIAGRLHHPNVVATLDVDDGEPPFLVMEYVEGASLHEILKRMAHRREVLPLPVALRVVHDALCGLHAAHTLRDDENRPLNLIHRDISPQNILVGIDGISRITDFGIAWAEERLTETVPGEVKGKWSYMAPEQLASQKITPKVDVFCSAIVLWEAITGRRLFKAASATETISKVLSGPIFKPSRFRREVPPELDHVVMHGLAREPAHRYQSARDFTEALSRLPVNMASPGEVGAFVGSLVADLVEMRQSAISATPSDWQRETVKAKGFGNVAEQSRETSIDSESREPSRQRGFRGRLTFSILVILAAFSAIIGVWWFLGASEPSSPAARNEPIESDDTQPVPETKAPAAIITPGREDAEAEPEGMDHPPVLVEPLDAGKSPETDETSRPRPVARKGRRPLEGKARRHKAERYEPNAL